MSWTSKQRITAIVIILVVIIAAVIFLFIIMTTINLNRPQILSLADGSNVRIQVSSDNSWVGQCGDGSIAAGFTSSSDSMIFGVSKTGSRDKPTYRFVDNNQGVPTQQYLSWNGNLNDFVVLSPTPTDFSLSFQPNGLNEASISNSGYYLNVATASPCADSRFKLAMGATRTLFIFSNT